MALTRKSSQTVPILEYKMRDFNYPPFTYNQHSAGYDLYTIKSKWIWPFKVTKIPINTIMVLPDNTFGMITQRAVAADMGLEVLGGIVNELDWMSTCFHPSPFINVKRIGLLPKKLKAGSSIAQVIIIPRLECKLLEVK